MVNIALVRVPRKGSSRQKCLDYPPIWLDLFSLDSLAISLDNPGSGWADFRGGMRMVNEGSGLAHGRSAAIIVEFLSKHPLLEPQVVKQPKEHKQ